MKKEKHFKKSIFLVIDGMRFDAIENDKKNKTLYPTLTKLAEDGVFKKIIANAQATQFVLPSLFSLTYPLDHGGYNYGIRDREESYIETIKKKSKKEMIMFSSCNAMGLGTSFERGFDEVYTTFDFRILIEQKINHTLLYEIDLYKRKKVSKKHIINIIKKEFGITLDLLKKYYDNYNKDYWPKRLHAINKFIAEQSVKEKKILINNPEAIIKKIEEVSGGLYWITLGKVKYKKNLKFFTLKYKTAITWRLMKLISKQSTWPFFFLTNYQVLFEEILDGLCKKLTKIKNDQWHIHMHLMDLHDCRSLNRFFHLIGRYRYFFTWFLERIKGNTKHRFVYASSLMYVDKCIKSIFEHMKKEKIYNDTLVFITADHGSYYPESPRSKLNVAQRTHYEDLDVPLIISHKNKENKIRSLCDSMDITATFLDMLNLPLHNSFKGKSIFKGEKKFVISESAGSGNADIMRKDLYFTIQNDNYKMMTVLSSNKLSILKLFNIKKDPREMIDLHKDQDTNKYKKIKNELLKNIFESRKILLEKRGVKLKI